MVQAVYLGQELEKAHRVAVRLTAGVWDEILPQLPLHEGTAGP